MMIFKRCQNCQQLYTGNKGCPECTKRFALINAKKRQAENEARKLYGSTEWAKCKKQVRLHYLDYDIWLLGIGQIYKCDKPYIHHIIERDEDPRLIFDLDNLITVSKESHEEIHRYYKSDRDYAMRRIAEGIKKYREMFKQ